MPPGNQDARRWPEQQCSLRVLPVLPPAAVTHVKCYMETEGMGTPLAGVRNTQSHKSGHMDEDSIWTPTCVGPAPFGGDKNPPLELGVLLTAAPLHACHHRSRLAETGARLSCGCHQRPRLCTGHSLCSLLWCKLPSLCVTCLGLHGLIREPPLVTLAPWRHTCARNSFRGHSRVHDRA